MPRKAKKAGKGPVVGIAMGSQSDWETMQHAAGILHDFRIPFEAVIVSAHRTPQRLFSYAISAAPRGLKIIIAGAGGAAHLPGMMASLTTLPVFGVPVESRALQGMDSLLSIAQMPAGIPVGTLAIGKPGAVNAGLLAVSVIALGDKTRGTIARLARGPNGLDCNQADENTQEEMKTLPPGSTIGILGGGQLARMTAMAAARLGYRCHIFCTSKDEPALQVAAAYTIAAFDDRKALEAFAAAVQVVTLEWENVPLAALEILSKKIGVHPSGKVLGISQDRAEEKNFARSHGIGTADFIVVHSAAELDKALKNFPLPAILKSTRMGYDGKGQVTIQSGMKAEAAWKEMGSEVGILESYIDFACEISVIIARRADGATAAYPAVENIHRNHILAETHAPANIDKAIADEAEHVARTLAEKLDVVGLLAVEMFVLRQPNAEGKRVLMNEIAPRPHNSGHWTIDACAVSQFEQLVRAICGLPLGSPAAHSRAVMHNLLGHEVDRWPELLKDSNACVHLYGKAETREGRKMGHVTWLRGGLGNRD